MLCDEIQVRAARPDEASDLSALALRSKAHWGYEQSFLNACRDELSYSYEQINNAQFEFHIFELVQNTVAFYALEFDPTNIAELEAMFVEPEYIGCGLGRALFLHATSRCRARDTNRLIIQADEFAAEFYTSMGAIQGGFRESGSISGRQLPLFEFNLSDK